MAIAAKVVGWLLVFLIGAGVPFAWILRDGLGPDAVDSAGLTAFNRTFWTFYVGPSVVILGIAWLLLFSAAKRGEEQAASVEPARTEGARVDG